MAKFVVRPALQEDAATIAHAVAMAIEDEMVLRDYCGNAYLDVLTEMARTEGTQYGWRNALVAECEGKAVGAIVGYDGAMLEALRNGTFAILLARGRQAPTLSNETEAGEFYIDSVGVFPEFRGMGVGQLLISSLCQEAFANGHERVGLIVEVENVRAQGVYSSIGFVKVGERYFFDHRMYHLQLEKNVLTYEVSRNF